MRYKGGVISATPPTVSTTSASGAWTLEQQLQYQAAGVWPVQYIPAYIEDVFSTYLYTGNGSTQTITNGIDLAGEGGLVWAKARDQAYNHALQDTARGTGQVLISNLTLGNVAVSTYVQSFNSNGWTTAGGGNINASGVTYASWTFRKQAKFFDVVTYTGNMTARTISHNLGSVPGCIIVKSTNGSGSWYVYHRSVGNTGALRLNLTNAVDTSAYWNNTTPTSTSFTVGADSGVNANSTDYVAYLFAHDAGGFGASGSDNVISCGSYTTNGSGVITSPVNLGYEPQWILSKRVDSTGNWRLIDSMRGNPVADGTQKYLYANLSDAETGSYGEPSPTSTGFTVTASTANSTYIYIAIRRGPMKTPTSGTSVFSLNTYTGTDSSNLALDSNIVSDAYIVKRRTGSTSGWKWMERLISYPDIGAYSNPTALDSTSTAAESNSATWSFSRNKNYNYDYFEVAQDGAGNWSVSGSTYTNYAIKRAPGFFDVVAYTGDSTLGRAVPHNLGAVPELMIVKNRNNTENWVTYSAATGNANRMILNSTAASSARAVWADTTPTSTNFYVGGSGVLGETNFTTYTYIAYLFATVSGVSKVGSYTGTGTTLQIDCGFTGGARFVLIKRTDSTGDWYVWDTARGIVAGNDPYLLLNSTAAEVTNTDYIDTYSAGFEISSTAPAAINANGGTFIFLAIA
jgi:hypothetical protein